MGEREVSVDGSETDSSLSHIRFQPIQTFECSVQTSEPSIITTETSVQATEPTNHANTQCCRGPSRRKSEKLGENFAEIFCIKSNYKNRIQE